ncbi:MAG: TIGR04283 family arsenosugar biosynthesis glycosyltransferase, partial [Pirellulales bacterium]
MTVSIIIPTFHEEDLIGGSVDRAWATGAAEVVVVDGGSCDATVRRAALHGARVLNSDRGRALQQNHGAAQATGSILLFLHADNWLERDATSQIRSVLRDASVLGGAFQQRIDAPGRGYRLLEWGNAARVRWRGLPYGDQGIFLRRTVFEQLGGFPPVELMEDLFLMRRLRHLARPVLLPGPLHVSPRRWRRHGLVRQTLRNWALLTAERCGIAPDRLARYYPPHTPLPELPRAAKPNPSVPYRKSPASLASTLGGTAGLSSSERDVVGG